jgi:dsRNA-specific ribonuclease
MAELSTAEAGLGLTFRDKTLLHRALTHRSFINENVKFPLEDNERLEFLGDAVLDFITAEHLYHRFPEMSEGQLTSLRAALVRTETLASFALEIGLGELIFLGRGDQIGHTPNTGGRDRQGCEKPVAGVESEIPEDYSHLSDRWRARPGSRQEIHGSRRDWQRNLRVGRGTQ